MRALTAPILACFVAALAWTTPASADTAYDQCIQRSSTNLEWAECGDALLQRLDIALNAAWKKANASIDEQSRKDLLAEQRAWLKFRDASCMFWANGSFGREGQVLHFFGCRAAITKARIADLEGVNEFLHQHQ